MSDWTSLGVTRAELLPPRTQQKQNPRDIALGFGPTAETGLRGDSPFLPAPAEQTQPN
jgi:hypothetical protein